MKGYAERRLSLELLPETFLCIDSQATALANAVAFFVSEEKRRGRKRSRRGRIRKNNYRVRLENKEQVMYVYDLLLAFENNAEERALFLEHKRRWQAYLVSANQDRKLLEGKVESYRDLALDKASLSEKKRILREAWNSGGWQRKRAIRRQFLFTVLL